MKFTMRFPIFCTLFLVFITGCTRYQVIPDHLVDQINTTLTYEQAKAASDSTRGQIVIWGGEVLSAVRDNEKTTVELLEVPLSKDHIPLDNPASSRGRFLAIDSHGEIIDPAIFKKGSRITVIGELLGLQTKTEDKMAYDYPVVGIYDMTVWEATPGANPFAGYRSYSGFTYTGNRPYVFWEGTRVAGSTAR